MPAILSCRLVAPLGNEGGDCDIAADPYRTVGILMIVLLFQIRRLPWCARVIGLLSLIGLYVIRILCNIFAGLK